MHERPWPARFMLCWTASCCMSIACCLLQLAPAVAEPYATFPELAGDYLGQEPPAEGEVEVFAPGILKPEGGFHSALVFDPTGTEAYWTNMSGTTFHSRQVDGLWSRPVTLPFDPEFGVREPMFADGGRRLYFLSRRPLPHDWVLRERIWFVEREVGGWTAATVIDSVVRAHPTHWQFSFTASGDLYFTSERQGVRGRQDIYVSRSQDGRFTEPVDLGEAINSDVRDFCPFIAPDGSYLIFARSVPEERNRSDLFISFRDAGGGWTPAVNMGEPVNSLHNETSPVVTPDGKYLFFLRVSHSYNELMWTPAGVIERLRGEVGGER